MSVWNAANVCHSCVVRSYVELCQCDGNNVVFCHVLFCAVPWTPATYAMLEDEFNTFV